MDLTLPWLWAVLPGLLALAALPTPAAGPRKGEQADPVATLVRQLGSNEYRQRQAAEKELVDLGVSSLPALRQAARGAADPEVRWRARRVVEAIEQRFSHEAACFIGHTDKVTCVAFTPDGRRVLSGSADHSVRLWDLRTGKEVHRFDNPHGSVQCLACAPDGRHVLAGGWDQCVRMLDLQTFQDRLLFTAPARIRSVAFSPDGQLSLVGDDEDDIWAYDIRLEIVSPYLIGHTGAVRTLTFSPDGRRVLSGSDDRTVRLWAAATGKALRCFRGHWDSVTGAVFLSEHRVLSAGEDLTLRIWDTATGKELRHIELQYTVLALALSADGRRALTGGQDRAVHLLDVRTGQELVRFRRHTRAVRSVAFSPNGRQALSGSDDGTVRLWDLPR